MYDHPLAVYDDPSEEDGSTECNSWGYVSGLTHAYFEQDDLYAGETLRKFLSKSGAASSYYRGLIRAYKKFQAMSVLREIQCLAACAIDDTEATEGPLFLPTLLLPDSQDDGYE